MTPTWLRQFHKVKPETARRAAMVGTVNGSSVAALTSGRMWCELGQRRNFHDARRVALLNHTTPRLLRL